MSFLSVNYFIFSYASLVLLLASAYFFHKSFGFSMPDSALFLLSLISVLGQITFSQVSLWLLVYVFIFSALIGIFLFFTNRLKNSKKSLFQRSDKMVVVFFSIIIFRQLGSELHVWDDFSHWGYATRYIANLALTGEYIGSAYSNYPPGLALNNLFINLPSFLLQETVTEQSQLLGQGFIMIFLSWSLFEYLRISRTQWNCVLVCLIIFLGLSISVHSLRTLMADGVLAFALALFSLRLIRLEHDLKGWVLTAAIGLWIVTLKPAGLMLVALISVARLITMLAFDKRPFGKPIFFAIFGILLVSLLLFWSWKFRVHLLGLSSSHDVEQFRWSLDLFPEIVEIACRIVLKVFLPINFSEGFQPFGFFFFVSSLGVLFLGDRGRTRREWSFWCIVLGGYVICLALMYTLAMSPGERTVLHSFQRYWALIFAGYMFWFVEVVLGRGDSRQVWLASKVVLFLLVISVTDLKSFGYLTHHQRLEFRGELNSLVESHYMKFPNYSLFTDFSCDSGLINLVARFDHREKIENGEGFCAKQHNLLRQRQGAWIQYRGSKEISPADVGVTTTNFFYFSPPR